MTEGYTCRCLRGLKMPEKSASSGPFGSGFELSTLFATEASFPDSSTAFGFGDSILFSKPDPQAASSKETPEKEPISHAFDPEKLLLDAALSDYSLRPKEVNLFCGNTITLHPRVSRTEEIDLEKLGLDETNNLIDMDALFEKIAQRKSLQRAENRIKSFQTTKKKASPSQMWTEKYKPSTFMQLCTAGNDKQFRLILTWLKNWSPVVFKKPFDENDGVDALGRPHKKFLLVHGPPGVGKTSAIHILARQLGYSIQELNAANSMDTLPQAGLSTSNNASSTPTTALKLKIMNALTSNTITSNGKPSCLVIDEIDSSINSNEIIKVLNDIAQADYRAMSKSLKSGLGFQDEETKKKNEKYVKANILNRPIICIANDIYQTRSTSSYGGSPMDKLRPLCEIVAIKKAHSSKDASGAASSVNALRLLKDFLMEINERERLGLHFTEIGEIVEECESDIRACLNHMQFSGRKLDPTAFSRLDGQNVTFNKDSQISWFAMVDMLFKRDAKLSKEEGFAQLLDYVLGGGGKSANSSSGSLDKVVRGSFYRYLDAVYFQDDSLMKPAEFSDWLSFYESMRGESDIGNYASLISLKTWSLFSEINPRRIQPEQSLIPNSRALDFETFELAKQNKSTIKRILGDLPINIKVSIGAGIGEGHDSFACYFLPYLNKMLSPDVGSSRVKSTLLDHEKRLVEKLSKMVRDFNLKLENHRDLASNQVTLHIAPNWEPMMSFKCDLAPTPLATLTKQNQIKRQWLFPLIHTELDRLKMEKSGPKRQLEGNKAAAEKEPKKKKARASSSIEFFRGQHETGALQPKGTEKKGKNHEATRIWVKYHEGFSNAVRKNIGWNDLWVP